MDERILLQERLEAIGLPKDQAMVIALDAGMGVVTKEYLQEIIPEKELQESVMTAVFEFYSGKLMEDYNK